MVTSSAIRAIFFDARDTLGEVDSPGHLIPYRPSTEQMLEACARMGVRLGVITNLPDGLTDEQGKDMVVNAILREEASTRAPVTIGRYIDRRDVITNKAAGANKPDHAIYEFAAGQLGLRPSECLFVGENQNEVLGAVIAGMQGQRKQSPPGRDFAPALVGKVGESAVDSGRQFEALFEHEHLLGERIFACGGAIGAALAALTAGKAPPLDQGRWISPPAVTVPPDLYRAMAYFVHLIDHFADQVHLRAEEAMLEVAVACGMDQAHAQWVFNQHEQARAYWGCLDVAWRRIKTGDPDDRFFALIDFQRSVEAFVYLFKAHAVREDDAMYPEAGRHFNDSDDALVLNLITHTGPSDITPYVGMVQRMEALLGLPSPIAP